MSVRDYYDIDIIKKPLKVSRWDLKFYFLAVLSGVLYGVCFPPFESSYLVFGALVPLLVGLVESDSGRKSWLLGLFFGVSAALLAIPWIFFNIGAAPLVRLFSGISLIFVVGIFHAFFAWFAWLSVKFWGRWTVWLFPIFWLGMEQVMYYEEITFPWIMLCNTLTYKTAFIQIADLGGSSFVSLLIIFFNVAAYAFISEVFRPRKKWFKIVIPPVLLVAVFLLVRNYGINKLAEYDQKTKDAPKIPIALIHPSLEAESKWRNENLQSILDLQMRLTDSLADSVKLIVWGEANFPGYLHLYPSIQKSFADYAVNKKVSFLVGALGFDWINDSTYYKYNSSFCFFPDGRVERYDKDKLVPFGEAFPYSQWIPWVKNISLGQANYDRGNKFTVFNGGDYKFAVSICYEGIFSYYNAEFVKNGADFLVNISNDAWYEKSNQNYQHSRFNIYRAIENRRSIARLANRAETAYIDPAGRLTRLFEPEQVIGKKIEIAILKEQTFFTKNHNLIKDFFCSVAGLLFLALPLSSIIIKKRKKTQGIVEYE